MQASSKLARRGRLVDPPLLIFQFSNFGPVVRRPISANPGLNFTRVSFLFIKSIFSDNFLYSF